MMFKRSRSWLGAALVKLGVKVMGIEVIEEFRHSVRPTPRQPMMEDEDDGSTFGVVLNPVARAMVEDVPKSAFRKEEIPEALLEGSLAQRLATARGAP